MPNSYVTYDCLEDLGVRNGIIFSTKIFVVKEIVDTIKSTSWRLFLARKKGGFVVIGVVFESCLFP